MKYDVIAVVDLPLSNRDGELYAVKTTQGCFLVLVADTYHNDERFPGLGSTEHAAISEQAFDALARSGRLAEEGWQ